MGDGWDRHSVDERQAWAVWTVLYAMMAVAAWIVWQQAGAKLAVVPLGLFMIQLLLNIAWSWTFFGLHQPNWASAELV